VFTIKGEAIGKKRNVRRLTKKCVAGREHIVCRSYRSVFENFRGVFLCNGGDKKGWNEKRRPRTTEKIGRRQQNRSIFPKKKGKRMGQERGGSVEAGRKYFQKIIRTAEFMYERMKRDDIAHERQGKSLAKEEGPSYRLKPKGRRK